MENKHKKLDLDELEQVNGGLFIPTYPYVPDEDENSSDNSGGATGGW